MMTSRSKRWLAGMGLLAISAGILSAQVTEATATTPVGTWSIESDLAWRAEERWSAARDGVHERESGFVATLVNYGLTENVDVQLGWSGWIETSVRGPGATERVAGAGDLWVRTKWNFAGDETEAKAWSLLPYVKLPTAAARVGNGAWEPGVALVHGTPMGSGWFNAMLAHDWHHGDAGERVTAGWGSAVWGWALDEGVSGYVELMTEWDLGGGAHATTAGIGVSWTATPRLTWDVQILAGLNRAAVDWMPTLRLVWVP